MNVFDIIMIIVIIAAFIRGIIKGFIVEIASLAGLVLGIAGAVLFSGVLAGWLEGYVAARYVSIVAFIILFIGIILCVHLLGKAIDSLVKAIALGWLNRILGGFFAIFKAAMLVSILILLIDLFGLGEKVISPEIRQQSRLFNSVSQLAPKTFDMFSIDYEHLLPPALQPQNLPPVIVRNQPAATLFYVSAIPQQLLCENFSSPK